jgi:hypothetical protein
MKVMKYLSILFILMFGLSVFGQKIPPPPLRPGETQEDRDASKKASDRAYKEEKRKAEKQDKIEKKLPESKTSNNITNAVLEQVALFPDDYANKFLRFNQVLIGNLGTYTEGDLKVYLITVKSLEGKIFIPDIIGSDEISFVLADDMAKETQNYYQSQFKGEYTYLGVNLIVQTSPIVRENRKQIFLANVKCIQFLNHKGDIIKIIGSCQV